MRGSEYIVVTILVLMLVGLSFAIGVAFGVEANHADVSSLYLPVLAMAGNWVAGIGALGAVLTSLWLADRQRREDVESLAITLSAAMVPGIDSPVLSIDIVSSGRRPATVIAVSMRSRHSTETFQFVRFLHSSHNLPVTLHYGERVSLLCFHETKGEIMDYLVNHCRGRTDGVTVHVATTLKAFVEPLNSNLIKAP